jgi:3-methylcrotonyl-CoA carboxylase alpha subunit
VRSAWVDGDRVREVDLVPLGGGRWRVSVDRSTFEVTVARRAGGRLELTNEQGTWNVDVTAAGRRRFVRVGHADFVLERADVTRGRRAKSAGEGRLESPMPGVVTKVLVAPGEDVRKGQPLLAVEAMKMEHLIRAPREGKVARVLARTGEMVNGGVPLVELEGDAR